MIGIEVPVRQNDTVRLISSGRLREQSLGPLADSEEEFAKLASLESVTHGRLQAVATGLDDLDPRELVFGVPNYTFINAAFCYTRPGGNRFNDEGRGAWYAAFHVDTSLEEVTYHLTRALEETGLFENTTDYAELFADFIGPFQDVGAITPPPSCLDGDTDKGYPAGQKLAKDLIAKKEVSGIVYPSVRHVGGTCLAALYPAVVQNVRQGGLWRLEWSGRPEPTVTQNPTTFS